MKESGKESEFTLIRIKRETLEKAKKNSRERGQFLYSYIDSVVTTNLKECD